MMLRSEEVIQNLNWLCFTISLVFRFSDEPPEFSIYSEINESQIGEHNNKSIIVISFNKGALGQPSPGFPANNPSEVE